MKQYLIFPSNDFYSYLSVTIEPENLNQHLIEIEVLNEGENYKRKFLFNELMSILHPVKDGALIDSIKASMDEWGFEVKEKVIEPNLLHE